MPALSASGGKLMKYIFAWVLALIVLTSGIAAAQTPTEAEASAEMRRMIELRDSLKPIRGVVALPSAKASLNLGTQYYFLSAEDARKVLTEGWGNPPSASSDVLGMVFPIGKTFLDDTWGAVVRYEHTHYVSDEDASTADYDAMMTDIKASVGEENVEREKGGYSSLTVFGWAQPPTYNATRHDLIWAEDIQFGDEKDHTLNYDVRHLGRSGVLSMNIISTMSKLPEVRQAAINVGATAEFDAGSRYADYEAGDQKAEYGLAGLVAAGVGLGVAKKAGLLAVALVFLKKGAFIIAAAAAGLAGWVRKFLRRKDV